MLIYISTYICIYIYTHLLLYITHTHTRPLQNEAILKTRQRQEKKSLWLQFLNLKLQQEVTPKSVKRLTMRSAIAILAQRCPEPARGALTWGHHSVLSGITVTRILGLYAFSSPNSANPEVPVLLLEQSLNPLGSFSCPPILFPPYLCCEHQPGARHHTDTAQLTLPWTHQITWPHISLNGVNLRLVLPILGAAGPLSSKTQFCSKEQRQLDTDLNFLPCFN